MKILYIHQHFALPSEGGGGRPYQFARRLASQGHDVTMLCSGAEALEVVLDGVKIKRLPVSYENQMSIPRRLISFVDFMVRASIYSVRLKSDLIFASSTPLTVGIPGMVAKMIHRVPLVFEVRDLWPKIPIEMGFLTNPVLKKAALILEKLIYKYSNHVIALSPGMADGVKETSMGTAVTVIPNASDVELFTRSTEQVEQFRLDHGWERDEAVVVYAGGFGKVYSLDWVVELAAKLSEERISIVMLGQGSESEKLRAIAVKRGLDPEKIFVGKKSRDEVADYVSAADFVISSSRLDPCLEAASLNKVFDGFAAGRPILLNHEGWLTELVQKRKAGWKLDRDVDIAAKQLMEVANDLSSREQAGNNSKLLANEMFNRDKLFDQFSSVLIETSRSNERFFKKK